MATVYMFRISRYYKHFCHLLKEDLIFDHITKSIQILVTFFFYIIKSKKALANSQRPNGMCIIINTSIMEAHGYVRGVTKNCFFFLLLLFHQNPLYDQQYSENTKVAFLLRSHQRGHSSGEMVTLKVRVNETQKDLKGL